MRLSEVISAEHIKIPVQAGDRDSAIREIIESMSDEIPSIETAYNAVLEREKIMTTGVGNEIAIPHCKYAETDHFIIGMGISKEGIDFKAIDGKDVKLIFLLIGPEEDPQGHIKLLSRISRLMNNSEFRAKLIDSSSTRKALKLIAEEEKSHAHL